MRQLKNLPVINEDLLQSWAGSILTGPNQHHQAPAEAQNLFRAPTSSPTEPIGLAAAFICQCLLVTLSGPGAQREGKKKARPFSLCGDGDWDVRERLTE